MTMTHVTANDLFRSAVDALEVHPRFLMSSQEKALEADGFKFVGMREDREFECCGECDNCEGPRMKPVYRHG